MRGILQFCSESIFQTDRRDIASVFTIKVSDEAKKSKEHPMKLVRHKQPKEG